MRVDSLWSHLYMELNFVLVMIQAQLLQQGPKTTKWLKQDRSLSVRQEFHHRQSRVVIEIVPYHRRRYFVYHCFAFFMAFIPLAKVDGMSPTIPIFQVARGGK